MKRFLKEFNYLSFFAMLALLALGIVSIWSAGNARSELVFHSMWKSTLSTACVGIGLYFLFALIDYRRFLILFAWPLYGVALAMLIAVLLFGSTIYGGRRWLLFFQPSEISKLFLLGLLAFLLGEKESWFDRWRTSFRGLLMVGVLVGVPLLLILAEPDLGTTLTLVPAIFLMLLAANVWRKGLLISMGIVALLSALILGAVYEAEKPGSSPERRAAILRCLPLKEHQLKRVEVFLFPENDPQGAGYNLRQAKIAIGSGGFSGKGFGKGETNHLKYLPPAVSMNDFIFCVYAEETGYRGSIILIALFAALILSGLYIAFKTHDERGRLFALGFSTLIFAHVYINIAMSIGLLPITGLPLPFISSGRTFLVTVICGLGLIQSISLHDQP